MIDGKYISDLSTASNILSNDIFVCSQRDKYICNQKNSVGVETNTIVSKLTEEIAKIRNFGSMLSSNVSSYSKVKHNHDELYNKLSIVFYEGHPSHYTEQQAISYQFTGYPIIKSKIASYLSIGNLFVDGTLSTLYAPMSCIASYNVVPWEIAEPEIGTIKLTIVKRGINIDYKSDDFDGWLYPNGQTYDLSDFSLSSRLSSTYGNDDGKFTLPLLSNFIRLNGDMTKDPTLTAFKDGQNALIKHQHNLDVNATGKITIIGKAPYSKDPGTGATIHWGNGYVTAYQTNTGQYLEDHSILIDRLSSDNDSETQKCREKLGLPKSIKDKNGKIIQNNLQKVLDWIDKRCVYSDELKLKCKCNITAKNITIQNSIDSQSETYPNYFDIPVMIYVGKRKR